MERRWWVRLVVVPLVSGLLASALVYAALGRRPSERVEEVTVVRARRAVPAKTRLTSDMLAVDRIPARYASPSALRDPSQAVGRITVLPLAAGEVVLAAHLAVEGAPVGLSFRIPEGYRAVSIKVDEVSGVGGFVQPGDRVDVIALWPGAQPGSGRAVLLLEGVLVLGVNRDTEAEPTPRGRPPDAYSYLTLAVTPAQALDLAAAQAFGRVHLLLRPAAQGQASGR